MKKLHKSGAALIALGIYFVFASQAPNKVSAIIIGMGVGCVLLGFLK